MRQELLDFLSWITDNADDVFDIIDNQEELVDEYLKEQQRKNPYGIIKVNI